MKKRYHGLLNLGKRVLDIKGMTYFLVIQISFAIMFSFIYGVTSLEGYREVSQYTSLFSEGQQIKITSSVGYSRSAICDKEFLFRKQDSADEMKGVMDETVGFHTSPVVVESPGSSVWDAVRSDNSGGCMLHLKSMQADVPLYIQKDSGAPIQHLWMLAFLTVTGLYAFGLLLYVILP